MKCPLSLRKTLALTSLTVLALAVSMRAQTIPNPSFEADTFTSPPGYVSGNGAITGWTGSDNGRVGLNPASGSPFADNGTIPNGNNVAFVQSSGAATTFNTVISDLIVGTAYKVNFRVNARGGNTPNLKVEIDGTRIIDTGITPVTAANPYKYFAFDFTATATSQTMTLRNDAGTGGGDHTLLIDDFSIAPRNSGWLYAAWTGDSTVGLDGTKNVTHAYNFGSGANATINGVVFTGVPGGNPQVADSFSSTGLQNVFNGDGN